MELLWTVQHRREARRVVVDPRVDHDRAVARICLRGRRKAVDAARLDVDRVDLGGVVLCEDRELDRAAPG